MRLRRVGSSGSTTTGEAGRPVSSSKITSATNPAGPEKRRTCCTPGVRGLGRLLRDLDAVLPLAARLAHRAELVDAAERRLVAARDEPRADAPGVDARALLLEARDQVLVEVVAGDDLRRAQAGLVEDLPRLDAEVGEVPGVEADADRLVPALAQAQGHLGGAPDALERVVGVHEEDAVVGLRPRPGLEGLELRRRRPSPSCGRACPAPAGRRGARRARSRSPRQPPT